MTSSPTAVSEKPESNRDILRINRHACEVKGTLYINMAKKAQLDLSKL